MKKILLIFNDINPKLINNLRKLSKNSIYWTSFKHLEFAIIDNEPIVFDTRNKVELKNFDLIYLRVWRLESLDERLCTAIYLAYHHIKFIVTEVLESICTSKITEYFKLVVNGLSVPDSLFVSTNNRYPTLIKKYNFTFPLILKGIAASRGKFNFLIKSSKELLKHLKEQSEVKFVVQSYIKNDHDYRILVLGKNPGYIYKRTRKNKNDHRNHAYLGAVEEEVVIKHQQIVKDIVKSAKVLKREIAGVDFIYDETTGKYFILEVNSNPGFTFETTSIKEFPAFVQYIDQLIEDKSISD